VIIHPSNRMKHYRLEPDPAIVHRANSDADLHAEETSNA
jgi:hypothetical protein